MLAGARCVDYPCGVRRVSQRGRTTMTRILSIDGGGIRGVIPGTVLAAIEQTTGRPIAELFDVIAGTSTGGILACGLTAPDGQGKPRFSASALVDMYVNEGSRIFPHHALQNIEALVDEKYPVTGLETVLHKYVGESLLSETVTEIFVTAYDVERRKPKFFRSQDAKQDPTRNPPLWMVARATSAAPTYFEPFKLQGASSGEYEALVDGGVFANNPAMCAYVDGSSGPGQVRPDDMFLVSLGTGSQNRPLLYDAIKDYGKLQWAQPILDVVFDGISSTTDYQLAQIMGKDDYFRLQTELTIASDTMDDVRPGNLGDLQRQGQKLIDDNADALARICHRLTSPATP
ncbi:MAG: patatin-like phospholipase family protein [Candidatus Dormibacteraeota bacterium]|uniref:Patatin-like phospholipase family protein n=1 Tax=Candidatus Amunia macphersoniae TaxID=3127014 RepID=A0A934KLD2_9BACT|nr:patatin-like phospholipase family protein [Candidatus Dormibacteraeota bacterium]